MIPWLFSLMLAFAPMEACAQQADTSATVNQLADSLQADTLREVTVRAGRHIPLPGMVIGPGLKDEVVPPPSLGKILEKWSPGINDKITHPFAIKQRKKERRRKRSLKALEDFDRMKTFDELLHEAYIQQLREDSIEKAISVQADDHN